MPAFKPRELKKIILPSTANEPDPTKQIWVVMDVSPPKAADAIAADNGMTAGEMGLKSILARVVEWNVTESEDSNEVLPINAETFGLMSTTDYRYLSDQIQIPNQLTEDQKKTSSDTSGQAQQIDVQIAL